MQHLSIAAVVFCLALTGVFGVSSAHAQSAGDPVGPLSDLVGAKAGQAEGQVTSRGYTWVKTDKSGDGSYSYWTESGSNNCVTIRTEDGRYQSIVYATKFDCQGGSSDATASKSPNAGDPVPSLSDLVGARAGQAEGEVTSRGYKMVKTDKSGDSSYSYWTEKGTKNCVTIRTEEGRYQSIVYASTLDCTGSASDTTISKPSGTSVSELSDLVGAKAGQAEGQVTSRGYTWVKTDKQSGSAIGYWTEDSSGKCVKIVTSDGRYQSIDYTSKFSCKAAETTKKAKESGTNAHCKLFNNKSNNYKFDGKCEVNHNSAGDVYDVTLGDGSKYSFTGHGGKYKVQTPEGMSDHKATKIQSGGNTAFDWYKWQLMISQH